MALLSAFYPYILPWCPMVVEDAVNQAVVLAARDFCKQTNWHQDIFTLDAVAGVNEYDIDTPVDASVSTIMGVWFNNRPLAVVAANDVKSALALRGAVGSDTPDAGDPSTAYVKIPSNTTFWVYPIPDTSSTGTLTVRASYMPSRSARSIDDDLFEEWAEVIAAGALERLLGTVSTPYYSLKGSESRGKEFSDGIQRAAREARTGRVRTSVYVQPRNFA